MVFIITQNNVHIYNKKRVSDETEDSRPHMPQANHIRLIQSNILHKM